MPAAPLASPAQAELAAALARNGTGIPGFPPACDLAGFSAMTKQRVSDWIDQAAGAMEARAARREAARQDGRRPGPAFRAGDTVVSVWFDGPATVEEDEGDLVRVRTPAGVTSQLPGQLRRGTSPLVMATAAGRRLVVSARRGGETANLATVSVSCVRQAPLTCPWLDRPAADAALVAAGYQRTEAWAEDEPGMWCAAVVSLPGDIGELMRRMGLRGESWEAAGWFPPVAGYRRDGEPDPGKVDEALGRVWVDSGDVPGICPWPGRAAIDEAVAAGDLVSVSRDDSRAFYRVAVTVAAADALAREPLRRSDPDQFPFLALEARHASQRCVNGWAAYVWEAGGNCTALAVMRPEELGRDAVLALWSEVRDAALAADRANREWAQAEYDAGRDPFPGP